MKQIFPRSLRTQELYVAMSTCQKALFLNQELTTKYCLGPKFQGKKSHGETEIVDRRPRSVVEAGLSELHPLKVPRHKGKREAHPLAFFGPCIRK